MGWNDNDIINSLFANDENIEDTGHDIGQENAEKIFNKIKEDYIDLVNQAIIYYELEDENRIIRYRTQGDEMLKIAVNKVKIFGNEDSRRRINQMNLFLKENYEFGEVEDKSLDRMKENLGF